MIKYRCYYKGNGTLQFRGDTTVDRCGVVVKFDGIPDDADVTFEHDNNGEWVLVRRLSDGKCKLPMDFLSGVIHVTACSGDKIWRCEDINCFPMGEVVIVRPEVIDVSQTCADMEALVDELQVKCVEMEKKLNELLRDSGSGYDF